MLREKIEELLLSTGRERMENLLTYMRVNGFYEAPCSSQYHLCKKEGLAIHSLNVKKTIMDMAFAINYVPSSYNVDAELSEFKEKVNSLIIVSLLHDLGKMGQYGKANYVPNMIQDRKTKEMVQSEKKPFETNKNLLPVPHEIRSIQIASKFIELTEEEQFAILHHNGMYGDLKYQLNGKETPLQMLLHFADMWASRVTEV